MTIDVPLSDTMNPTCPVCNVSPYTSALTSLSLPSPHTCTIVHTVPYHKHNGRPNGVFHRSARARTHHSLVPAAAAEAVSVRVVRAPRAARALEAGAWRRVPRPWLVIVRGRQPSAGRRMRSSEGSIEVDESSRRE
jgi:hypothetical protein